MNGACVCCRYIFFYNFLSRRYRGRIAGTTVTAEGRDALELGEKDERAVVDGGPAVGAVEPQDTGIKEFEKYARVVFPRTTMRLYVALVRPLVSRAEWLACWTQAQKSPGSNRSRDAVV